MKHLLLILFALLAICTSVFAESELEVCRHLTATQRYHGNVEYRLPDGSRVDIVTDETATVGAYAFEVDWAYDKWKEAIGQSLFYSIETGKPPAILLLTKVVPVEAKHIERRRRVCETHGIALFVETTQVNPLRHAHQHLRSVRAGL